MLDCGVASGQFQVRTAAETYVPAGRFESAGTLARLVGEVETARREGWPGFQIAGDLSWVAERVPGLRLSGEIDLTNRQALAAVLAGRYDDLDDQAGPLTIDASGLRFADAATLAMLVRAARAAPGGLRVICSPTLARLLDLVAADPGVPMMVQQAS